MRAIKGIYSSPGVVVKMDGPIAPEILERLATFGESIAHSDRQLTDIFAIQDEITLAIVKQLKVELLAKERVAMLEEKHENLRPFEIFDGFGNPLRTL